MRLRGEKTAWKRLVSSAKRLWFFGSYNSHSAENKLNFALKPGRNNKGISKSELGKNQESRTFVSPHPFPT